MILALALTACKGPATQVVDPPTPPPPPDLTIRLQPGEVRAGVVTDESALFGGVSAEGQAGDLKIYNDRVQFVIQGAREGSYYVQTGGAVIDADIVRPEGTPGRDLVDEWGAMVGFGRLIQPEQITVVSDGRDGAAIIEVRGPDVAMALLTGVLEAPDFLPPIGVSATTTFKLEPDSWLLEVTTTMTASTPVQAIAMGDLLMGAPEVADSWTRGSGLVNNSADREVTGYLDKDNAGAIAILALPGQTLAPGGAAALIADLADMVLGFEVPSDLGAGQTRSWTRYYGAGPDLATLTSATLPETAALAEGTVTAPDGPVAGARVHILVDGDPWTVAVTDENGAFSTRVPPGAITTVAEGRGSGMFDDFPAGHTSWPAFAAAPVFERARASLMDGAPGAPVAKGRGMGTGADGLTLGEPARMVVTVDDGLPFTVRIGIGAEQGDVSIAPRRPSGLEGAGWSRGGPLTLEVEPGAHTVVVHRGMRYQAFSGSVTAVAGQTETVQVTLDKAFEHPGFLAGDPHSHASPSGDGQVSMEDRVLVQAAGGVQLHFGSDHDRVADYRPLVTALGLDPVLRSVVADEVSSVIRGHFNAYPLVPDPSLPNHGAVHWWEGVPETTDALIEQVRHRHGDIVVQSNHPLDNGMASAASWSPGAIARPTHFANDLDAMEVLNDGQHDDYFAVWIDLLNRGYILTPVGVSDSHGHFSATPGTNLTFIGMGSDDVSTYTDAGLIEAFRARNTIASLGVFLDLSVAPGTVIHEATELVVEAKSPSWATVSRLELWVNGALLETVLGTTATFLLDDAADASFVVVAVGDTPMLPVSNDRPWAMASAILLDHDDDGWEPPLAPLSGL